MTSTPMNIIKRPFSIEPYTNIMLPDGIFDTAIKKQYISCHYTNESDQVLKNVSIYLEGISDPGIIPVPESYLIPEIQPNASVFVQWMADFENGTPGKKIVSFIAQSEGMTLTRTIKNIFVSKTEQDALTGEYTCTIEEGVFKIPNLKVIAPRGKWVPCEEQHLKECPGKKGPWVPSEMTVLYYPDPPYAGIHGDLPFSDPWWKILAWIVAAVAAIVAIVAAIMGEGTAGTAISGTFDETTGEVECCTPSPGGIPGDTSKTVAGVASAIATGAAAVGMSDSADPWWRGQEATPPKRGELTVCEKVDIKFDYPDGAPNAGKAYPVHVKWSYERKTNANTYEFAVDEIQKNIHINKGVQVDVPSSIHAFEQPFVIKAKFKNGGGKLYKGDELYAYALARSPDGMYFFINLLDDGIGYDEKPNDGVYTGVLNMEEAYRRLLKCQLKLEGIWKIYVFAQDINDAKPDMTPQIAAQRIGGFMVASGLVLTFDPTLPCPLTSDGTITVVQ